MSKKKNKKKKKRTSTGRDIVQGDKVGGDKIFGDKVGGDKNVFNLNITLDQHHAFLQKREKEIRAELAEEQGKDRQRIQELEKELTDIQAKQANLEQSYKERTQQLQDANTDLQKFKDQFSPEQMEKAEAALVKGDSSEAEKLLKEVTENENKLSVVEELALAHYRLANLAYDRVDYSKSLKHHERAAQLVPENGLYLNDTGILYDTLDNYDQAIGYYEKALTIDLKTLGEEHPSVATRWNNLGGAWANKGDCDQAISYYEKAIKSDLQTFGEEHPKVATRWNNLGAAWRDKGDYDQAINYYEKALVVLKKFLEDDHPNMITLKNNIALAREQKNNPPTSK